MKLTNIQILRAFAAIAVVIYHSGVESWRICETYGRKCEFDFWPGSYGIYLFFMISGFIMVVTSWDSFGKLGATKSFLSKRIKRIVPLYWFITTLAVVGIYFVPSMLNAPVLKLDYVLASYLFWPIERVNGLVRPIANLGWTLNLEMFFYAVFAVALFFGRLRGILLAVGFLLAFTVLHMTGLFGTGGKFPSIVLNFWADPIIINFVVGIGVGVLYMKGVRTTPVENFLLLLIGVACAAAVEYNSSLLLTLPENDFFYRFSVSLPMVPVLVVAALGPQADFNKLATKIGLLLGDASYSLYLIHPFALRPFRTIWVKFVGDALPVWVFGIACFAMALLVGLACYYLAERPLTNYFTTKRSKVDEIRGDLLRPLRA
jgi:exopolysaccharide production protein ExoZ